MKHLFGKKKFTLPGGLKGRVNFTKKVLGVSNLTIDQLLQEIETRAKLAETSVEVSLYYDTDSEVYTLRWNTGI